MRDFWGREGIVGLAVLGVVSIPVLTSWDIPILLAYQSNEYYKMASGLLGTLYIGHQWYLTRVRSQVLKPDSQFLRLLLRRHKWWGTLGPLIFLIHAQKTGHSYLAALSGAFFGAYLLGLLHPGLARYRRTWLTQGSVIAHIGLSTLLTMLLAYHVFIAMYY